MKKLAGIFLMLAVILTYSSSQAKAEVKNKQLLGEWLYEASDVPYGYEKGTLIFAEKEGKTVCVIKLEAGEMPAENLKIEGNKISFSAMVDGNPINVELTREKDKLTGKAETPEGPKAITAQKK